MLAPLSRRRRRLTVRDMARRLPVLVGALVAVLLGSGVSAALVRASDESALEAATVTTVTAVTVATTVVPLPTTALATTTSRPPLTRTAATKALCADIDASVRLVAGGNTVGGGLRLLRAVNSYGTQADPSVSGPARRMLAAGLDGDLDTAAVATQDAATACQRSGFPISIPTSGPGPGIPGRDRPCGGVSC